MGLDLCGLFHETDVEIEVLGDSFGQVELDCQFVAFVDTKC